MKTYSTIDEIINYLTSKHKDLRDPAKHGVHGLMMLRRTNGRRFVFGEINGFRIFDWHVFDGNILAIDMMSVGFGLGSKNKIQQSSRLLLSDLAVINVYDHSAEFLSESNIDFAYVLNSYPAEMQHLYEWVNNKSGTLRARWINSVNDTELLLERLSVGRKIKEIDYAGRNVDMDFEEF